MPTITELPADVVFKDFVEAHGMGRDGRRNKNPWQKDMLPKEILDAPVEWFIFNVGPIVQIINAGSMGQYHLMPPAPGKRWNEPLKIKKYMVDWADQGDYKQKPIIMEGAHVAKEWVTPAGEKGNTDLRNWGVFATKNNPPSEDDLATANALLRTTLDKLIKYADGLYQDPKTRSQITAIYHVALEARNETRPWHGDSKETARCEGCGKSNDLDIAKCQCGAILNWEKARKLRLVSKADYDEAVAEGLVKVPAIAASTEKRVPPAKV